MVTMSKHERALSYAKRLKETHNLRSEANAIKKEVEGLVWSEGKQPLPKSEKIAILDEVKRIIQKGERTPEGSVIVEAGDNSGIIDIINTIGNDLQG